ncbi:MULTISPECIES: hypothetical protein [unclassified Caballeronia]|uniref:hypothetical protein n=1 Tax=unclassified Caballeronia TaxID=2646786 RepID=UPI00285AE51D|nr:MULTISPECIES: hypothetical protein [unclassified Caballeronia]MDR5753013.1 hypothetical protein [Caballeronia sp. LZ024]MDR5845089.1 hypothetical protein [Caballeronia sp. LZ031]
MSFESADFEDNGLLVRLRRAMALRGWFKPHDLLAADLPTERALDVVGRLYADCEVGRGPRDGMWRMLDAPRRKVLSDWEHGDAGEAVQEALEHDARGDPVTLAIGRALGAIGMESASASAREIKDFIGQQLARRS